MTRVAVLDDYARAAHRFADWASLGEDVEVVFLPEHHVGDALVAALSGYDVAVAMRERSLFSREVLSRLPDLRLLVATGMTNAAVDLEAAADAGIVVSGTRSDGSSTLEVIWALILALVKRLPAQENALRDGRWQIGICDDLANKTLGLLGLGRLGTLMVPVARAFSMDVIAWSQNLKSEHAEEVGARAVTKDELVSASDVLSIHVRLSERTRALIGAKELAAMKPTAYLVNTSRGPIVDEAALVEALTSGAIAGAALDVYDEEPLPAGHRLLSLDNVVVTPHLGYVSEKTFSVFYPDAVEDIAAWLGGSPVRVLTVEGAERPRS